MVRGRDEFGIGHAITDDEMRDLLPIIKGNGRLLFPTAESIFGDMEGAIFNGLVISEGGELLLTAKHALEAAKGNGHATYIGVGIPGAQAGHYMAMIQKGNNITIINGSPHEEGEGQAEAFKSTLERGGYNNVKIIDTDLQGDGNSCGHWAIFANLVINEQPDLINKSAKEVRGVFQRVTNQLNRQWKLGAGANNGDAVVRELVDRMPRKENDFIGDVKAAVDAVNQQQEQQKQEQELEWFEDDYGMSEAMAQSLAFDQPSASSPSGSSSSSSGPSNVIVETDAQMAARLGRKEEEYDNSISSKGGSSSSPNGGFSQKEPEQELDQQPEWLEDDEGMKDAIEASKASHQEEAELTAALAESSELDGGKKTKKKKSFRDRLFNKGKGRE